MPELNGRQKAFLNYAIDVGALKFGDFTLKSGRESPWFWNAGDFVGSGSGMRVLGDTYASIIKVNGAIDTDYIIGPADKGNDLSAATTLSFHNLYYGDLNRIVERKSPKQHGDKLKDAYWAKWFYGSTPKEGSRIWMVDDVLTTARTKHDLIEKLSKYESTLQYEGLVITVDRQELNDNGVNAIEEFSKNYMPVYSVIKANDIYSYLLEPKIFDKLKRLGTAKDGDLNRFRDYLLMYGTDEVKANLEVLK